MALSYLLDEHLRGPLWRAVQSHNATDVHPVDVVRVGDSPQLALGANDELILQWAQREGRILVTFDRSTIPDKLNHHLASGRQSPGVFMVRRSTTVSQLLEFLILATKASAPEDWANGVHYIPL